MIYYIDKGAYWKDKNSQIIFNPVSVSKSKIGQSIFNKNIRNQYTDVYESYRDYIVGVSKKRLLGDIHLVQIEPKKIIMNAFIFYDDKLDFKAFSKTLIELFNLIEEYKISASIKPIAKDEDEYNALIKIIETVFQDCKSDIYVYTSNKNQFK